MSHNKILLLILLFWSAFLYAEPGGTCWSTDSARQNLSYPPSFSFSSNKAGSSAHFDMRVNNGGTAKVNETCQGIPNGVGTQAKYTKYEPVPSWSLNGTDIILSPYFKITGLRAWESGNQSIPVPGTGTMTHFPAGMGSTIPGGDYVVTQSMDVLTTNVSFDIVLTKDILGGGIQIPGGDLFQQWYSAIDLTTFASQPAVTYVLASVFVPIPTICNINNGQQINVDFGNIQSQYIGASGLTSQARMDKAISIDCSSSLNQGASIEFDGTPSSFSDNAIKSSSPDIGVSLLHDNKVIPVNTSFEIQLQDGKATVPLTFAIVKDPKLKPDALQGGSFSASATLILATD